MVPGSHSASYEKRKESKKHLSRPFRKGVALKRDAKSRYKIFYNQINFQKRTRLARRSLHSSIKTDVHVCNGLNAKKISYICNTKTALWFGGVIIP